MRSSERTDGKRRTPFHGSTGRDCGGGGKLRVTEKRLDADKQRKRKKKENESPQGALTESRIRQPKLGGHDVSSRPVLAPHT